MKILLLSNNELTKPLADWLSNDAREEVISFSQKITPDIASHIKPDLILSYNYRHIIKEGVLDFMKKRALNLHISLLPWNRGAHPNFWSFIDGTPKGVTIHLIDKGIDTGDILFQEEMSFDENDETLRTSYFTLHKEIQRLFMAHWEDIKYSNPIPLRQKSGGSFHFNKDFEIIKASLGDDFWDLPINVLKQRYKAVTQQ